MGGLIPGVLCADLRVWRRSTDLTGIRVQLGRPCNSFCGSQVVAAEFDHHEYDRRDRGGHEENEDRRRLPPDLTPLGDIQ